ncbi:MAG: FAD-dependent oxidoreductase, partial [Synechococcaceae cyanobacterium RL_1_2]|nr:FAD-dependent oxidoreductase [Synechococcaceae cyanobacterium RL_1_2]
MISPHPVTKICIVGGGFGGLYTALKLEQLPWPGEQKVEITLIDKSDRFIFLPLLYELVTGEMQTWEVAPSFAELLGSTAIRFVQGEVSKIDVNRQEIRLTNRQTLDYDRLVIGVGGCTPTGNIPGVMDYAIPFRTVDDAHRLKEKLRLLELNNPDKIRVAIVGGGYSGVELACKISDRLGKVGRVRVIDRGPTILKQADDFNRQSAEEALQKRQVWIDYETEVTELTQDTISLLFRGEVDPIPVDLVLWTVGNDVSPLIKELDLKKNDRGQLYTNPYLQLDRNPEIFALGDG